jgi:sugar lactone lactonase YvrE
MACAACGAGEPPASSPPAIADSTDRVAVVTGLAGPEAVRYDPDQDVYFVGNMNGEAAGDSNGYISRVAPDGSVEAERFMEGSADAPLHGPRGMFITGDTLWVADADGLHGFDRRTGAGLTFVDFTAFEPGFLNDIVQGPDGALYITDTGLSRIYRMSDGAATIAVEDSTLHLPNGITWDPAGARFLLASWGEGPSVTTWDPASGAVATAGVGSAGRFDGIELVDGRIMVASQRDSALVEIGADGMVVHIRMSGRPADIGVDTQRGRVAVPYIALDRVDIWELPGR